MRLPAPGRGRLGRLEVLSLLVTTRCQSRCQSCGYRLEGEDLTPEELDGWLPILATRRPRVILYSGGEPLLHRQLGVMQARLRSSLPGACHWLLSNGLGLARHVALASRFDRLTLSLDGWDRASYRHIRGVDGWAGLQRGVRALRRIAPALPISARITLHEANVARVVELYRASGELGLDSVSFLLADPRPGSFGDPTRQVVGGWTRPAARTLAASVERLLALAAEGPRLEESPETLRALAERAARLARGAASAPPCDAPWISLVIEPGGRSRPCFFQPPYADTGPAGPWSPAAIRWRRALSVPDDSVCAGCTCSLARPSARLRSLLPLPRPRSSGDD